MKAIIVDKIKARIVSRKSADALVLYYQNKKNLNGHNSLLSCEKVLLGHSDNYKGNGTP